MAEDFYGQQSQRVISDRADTHVEELQLLGYTVIPSVLTDSALDGWRAKIDAIYHQQENAFGGAQALEQIQERDMCRCPLLYDHSFIDLAAQPIVMQIVHKILGEWAILSLQNAIINRPGTTHHQGTWHRDLPHAQFTSSHPIAVNAMVAIDEFSVSTGATHILPFTHHSLQVPSAEYIAAHAKPVMCKPGSIVMFDAMIFHRAGVNTSSIIRRGVNHLYTLSMIKQQYDFPRAFGSAAQFDEPTQRLLGYPSAVPLDDRSWRKMRAQRLTRGHAA